MNKQMKAFIVAAAALLGVVVWSGMVSWLDSAPGMDEGMALRAGRSAVPSPQGSGSSDITHAEHAALNRMAAESVDSIGRIGFTVVDGSRKGIGGATVSLVVKYEGEQVPPSRSFGVAGADGSWWSECAHQAIEYVLVVVWHSSHARTTHKCIGSQVKWMDRRIDLGPVMLESGCQLDGSVLEDVGRSLRIQHVGADISPVRLVWGRNGVFWSAERILPGRYRLSLDGVVSGKVSPEEIEIVPGALSHHVDVRIIFQDRGPADAISGIVTDWLGAPVPGCELVATGHGFHGGVSDSEGRFVVYRDDDPSASVRLSVDAFHGNELRFAFRPWIGARSYAWGESHVKVELVEACSIRLHVFVDDQRLRSYNYRLYQVPSGAEAKLMSAIDDGSGVLVACVRPGENKVVVIPPSSLGVPPWIGTVDVSGIQQDCYMRLDAPPGVRVMVQDQANRGLPDVQIEVLDISGVTSADPMRLESISPNVMFELGFGLPVLLASGVTTKDGTCELARCVGKNLVIRASWRGHVVWQELREPEPAGHREVVIAMPSEGGCVLSIDLDVLPAKDPRWAFYGVRLVSLDLADGNPTFFPWDGDGVKRLGEAGLVRFDACRAGRYFVLLFGGQRSGQWIGLPPSLGQIEIRDGQVTEMNFSVAFNMGSLRVAPVADCEGSWRVVAEVSQVKVGDPPLSPRIADGRAGAALIEGMPAGRYQVMLYTGGSNIDCGEVDIQADRLTILAPDLGRKLRLRALNNGKSIGGGTRCRVMDIGSEQKVFEGYTDADGCIDLFVQPRVHALHMIAELHDGGQELRGDVTVVGQAMNSFDVALR